MSHPQFLQSLRTLSPCRVWESGQWHVPQVRGGIITDRGPLTHWPGVWQSYSSVTLATLIPTRDHLRM